MAKDTTTPNTTAKAETEEKKPTVKVPTVESKYFISDFVEQAEKFGTSKFVVKTALEMSKKTEFTLAEAKGIINKFRNKEAKK